MLQLQELGAAMAFALSFVLCEGKQLANRRELIKSNNSMPTTLWILANLNLVLSTWVSFHEF